MQTNYMGLTITELYYGGAFACLPLLWGLASAAAGPPPVWAAKPRPAHRRPACATGCHGGAGRRWTARWPECSTATRADWLGPLLLAAALAWALGRAVSCRPTPLIPRRCTAACMLHRRCRWPCWPGACYNFCVYFAAEPRPDGPEPCPLPKREPPGPVLAVTAHP